jgi:hypothetical protein
MRTPEIGRTYWPENGETKNQMSDAREQQRAASRPCRSHPYCDCRSTEKAVTMGEWNLVDRYLRISAMHGPHAQDRR